MSLNWNHDTKLNYVTVWITLNLVSFLLVKLFMIEGIRDYILVAEGAADDSIEAEEMEDKPESEVCLIDILFL